MTPVTAAKKLSKFDPKTFLSTIDGGRKIAAFPKKQPIFVQGDPSCSFLYTERKGKTHGCFYDWEGSHHRHSE